MERRRLGRGRGGLARSERAFTLIELLVVVLVIGVLVLIAVPVYSGARDRASDTVAKSTIGLGYDTGLVVYTDTGDWDDVTPAGLSAAEGSISFTSGRSTGPRVVSVRTHTRWFRASVRSDTGLCFYIYAQPGETVKYGSRQRNNCRAQHARFFATGDTW